MCRLFIYSFVAVVIISETWNKYVTWLHDVDCKQKILKSSIYKNYYERLEARSEAVSP